MPKHIVFIEGWAATARVWREVLAALPAHFSASLLPWHTALVDPAVALLAHLHALPAYHENKPEIILCGWSLGGMLALEMAHAAVDNISALVLAGSTARMCADGAYSGVEARQIKAMLLRLRRQPEELLRDFAALAFAPAQQMQAQEEYAAAARELPGDALRAGLEYLLERDLRGILGAIATPTRVIHARDDMVIPESGGAYLAAHLPRAEYALLQNGAHALPATSCAAIIDAVLRVAAD